jgi:hypothetical protein
MGGMEHAEPPRQVLDELPGDAAGAAAARDRPFDRRRASSASIGRPKRGIALDHGEEGVLVAIVEADPEAEAVGERDLLLDRLAGRGWRRERSFSIMSRGIRWRRLEVA